MLGRRVKISVDSPWDELPSDWRARGAGDRELVLRVHYATPHHRYGAQLPLHDIIVTTLVFVHRNSRYNPKSILIVIFLCRPANPVSP